MLEQLKKHHFTREELYSFVKTFGAVLAAEGLLQIQTVLAGDWSKPALLALLSAVLRSTYKAVMLMAKPQNATK